jgi:hypothetical protein
MALDVLYAPDPAKHSIAQARSRSLLRSRAGAMISLIARPLSDFAPPLVHENLYEGRLSSSVGLPLACGSQLDWYMLGVGGSPRLA